MPPAENAATLPLVPLPLPASSVILVLAFKSRRIEPTPVILLTVTVIDVPEDAETLATEPVAEPEAVVTEKSSVEILLALSSKPTVKVTEVAELAGEPLRVMLVTAGGVESEANTEPEKELGLSAGYEKPAVPIQLAPFICCKQAETVELHAVDPE